MNIALDWDDTFTRDPELWVNFVSDARRRGHTVKIVTFRHPHHTGDIALELEQRGIPIPIIATGHNQKRPYCNQALEWFPDVWIDDSPEYIVAEDNYKLGMLLAKQVIDAE